MPQPAHSNYTGHLTTRNKKRWIKLNHYFFSPKLRVAGMAACLLRGFFVLVDSFLFFITYLSELLLSHVSQQFLGVLGILWIRLYVAHRKMFQDLLNFWFKAHVNHTICLWGQRRIQSVFASFRKCTGNTDKCHRLPRQAQSRSIDSGPSSDFLWKGRNMFMSQRRPKSKRFLSHQNNNYMYIFKKIIT